MMSKVSDGQRITYDDALQLIRSEDLDTLARCANELTKRFAGNQIDVETLINAKSGTCPEDCSFCAQSSFNSTIIEKYPLLPPEKILAQAENAMKNGANSFCIVCAYRAPPEKDFKQICETIKLIRENLDIEVNVSLGFMTLQRARELKSLGVKRYNHNLETAKSYF